jgi:hypothetical protein
MTREITNSTILYNNEGNEFESYQLPLTYYKEEGKGPQVQLVAKNATFT